MKYKRQPKTVIVVIIMATIGLIAGATVIGAYAAVPQMSLLEGGLDNDKNNVTPLKTSASIQNLALSSSGLFSDNTKELNISFNIDNGGVEILRPASHEIEAIYDSEYYDVSITNMSGKWSINISGKVSMMGKANFVQVYIPDMKCTMDINICNGNFSYGLPKNCTDTIRISAENAGISFMSKTENGFTYSDGTGVNEIGIKLTGYTSVAFDD